MTRFVLEKKGGPAYRQLYAQLKDAIAAGIYPPGSKLPSKRALAAELGVSVITAEHALALLADEGWVEPRERSGVFVLGRGAAAPVRRAELEEMSLPTSVPEDFPFSVLARIMRRTLAEKGERILAKSPPLGTLELRGAIRRYLARSRALDVDEEQILIGSGAEALYSLVVQLLGRETVFALEDPCWEKIRRAYEANGARCVALAMDAEGIALRALDGCRAGALHVTPYHSYPSGITSSADRRAAYAAWAEAQGAWLIEDDYDAELAAPRGRIETLASLLPERTLYLSTFSKTVAPSFRTGYLVLPEALMERYRAELGFYSCSVPVYDQYVLAEFIDSGAFERSLSRRKKKKK